MNGGWRETFHLAARLLLRDWRAGELTVLVSALLVAVTAMTGVAFLTDRVGQAVELRAGESLAGGLRVDSAAAISADYDRLAGEAGLHGAGIDAEGGGQETAVVEGHRLPQHRRRLRYALALVAPGLADQAGLV